MPTTGREWAGKNNDQKITEPVTLLEVLLPDLKPKLRSFSWSSSLSIQL